jgi:hypothetical protein
LLVSAAPLARPDDNSTPPSRISRQGRIELLHSFSSELVYIRTPFPMGKTGLTLKDGALSPSGQQLQLLMEMWGPSVKPGDRVMITGVAIASDHIRFEINGGPVKKQKWYQHVQVGMGDAVGPVGPTDDSANPRGSYLDLVFDRYVPELSSQQLKDLLSPAFDFHSKSAAEAYLETLPAKVQDAIRHHRVLVGMNREMVICAKGRPEKKVREKQGETEYEDWIYGEPPADVDFIRVVGDEVVRVETMKVTGEKIVRTEREIESDPKVASAARTENKSSSPAPSLRRPGEAAADPSSNSSGSRPPPPLAPPPSDPTPTPVPN